MKKGIKRIVTAALAAVLMVTQLPVMNSKAAAGISIYGKAHVQTYGDTNGKIVKENGIDTLVLGTRGQAKRVESITVNLQINTGYTGTIQYRVHRQTYGWTDWTTSGQPAGTTGQGKRLEAIQIMLVKKGAAAPGATVKGITQTTSKSFNDANASGSTENPGNNQSSTKPSTDTSKPTWIAEQTVTVTYYQCDSCNNIYRTKEEMEQHFAFWDPKYNVICSCGVNKKGTIKTETFTIRDGYWSDDPAPATRKVVWVATEPAYTETKEIIQIRDYWYCFGCNQKIYCDEYIEGDEQKDPWCHSRRHLTDGSQYNNFYGGLQEKTVTGTETVTEPEYGYYEVQ